MKLMPIDNVAEHYYNIFSKFSEYILQKITSSFDHFPLKYIVNTCVYMITYYNIK